MKWFSFVPGRSSIIVAPSLWTTTMTVIVIAHEIFKTHCPLPHHLWVGPNDGNTFGNAPWNDSRRKISYKDSFNSVVSNVWKMPISWELPSYTRRYINWSIYPYRFTIPCLTSLSTHVGNSRVKHVPLILMGKTRWLEQIPAKCLQCYQALRYYISLKFQLF